ncbi:hypothetical protein IM816_02565 [Luteibacter flocculans]|uniref:Lysozyme inhibitor LprI-like N-terminal domain-containing protein n=1 Tax=Luteibacter flocculans TaxID=2780091 RepID=A0ABY4T803_9GAMM|nr:lysozyme inhibitor LprI family protein [Luteibacter flocculans]URL59019.1 hypothetical protein IM816_02565 [Luteibacter flocculans]
MKTIRLTLAATLWLAPFLAQAAGFDCAKASTAIEKAICASPTVSALDGQLGEAFRAAVSNHPDKRDALTLDQRHWLADRDAAISNALRDHPGKPLAADVADYQGRIDFLRGLDTKAPPPLDRVREALPRLPAGSRDILADLSKAGLPVAVATEVRIDEAKDFPFTPDAPLRKALEELDASSGYRKLPGMPVSSIYSIGGTANCWTEAPFRLEGDHAIAVDPPRAWDSDCMSLHGMARVGDDVIATVLSHPSVDETNLGVSRWEGKRFGPDAVLSLRFDHTLAVTGSACAPAQSPCDGFATAALAAATRYARSPVPGALDRSLQKTAKSRYADLLAAAQSTSGLATKGGVVRTLELPTFGSNLASGQMNMYGEDATFFPIDVQGETLLGLIGHGHIGWRVNDDWLVSAWRLKAGKLEAVASAYVTVQRGVLLLSSIVPPPPPVSH